MPSLFELQSTASVNDVAQLLGYKPKMLAYLLYKKPAATKYTTFDIPKRSGGTRTISAPDADIKLLQQKLSELLLDCLDEIRGSIKPNRRLSHGFERRLSIMTNADRHKNRRFVLNLDLEDFFGSINFGRVRGFFIHDKNFKLRKETATILAQIACHENSLPQGSPCSPVIANLVAGILDLRMAGLATKHGCRYSRYADDITFSTNRSSFPPALAFKAMSGDWELGNELVGFIKRTGFSIHKTKTRMQYKRSQQIVTGLVVNAKINVPKESRKRIRAMTQKLYTTGSFQVPSAGVLARNPSGVALIPGTWQQLSGAFGYIGAVGEHTRKRSGTSDPLDFASTGIDEVHRRFLVFTEFYATKVPVIICEGKTDNVYLANAINSLSVSFPTLLSNPDASPLTTGIRFFKYERTVTAKRLGLPGGGAGNLSNFITAYAKDVKRFKAPGMTRPVILIVDNDDAAKGVLNAARHAAKNKNLSLQAPFCHIIGNLYLTAIPKNPGQASAAIEDLFSDALKATQVAGKSLSLAKNLDISTQYGKQIFAQKVVAPNADTIDFSGFIALLTNIAAIVALYP